MEPELKKHKMAGQKDYLGAEETFAEQTHKLDHHTQCRREEMFRFAVKDYFVEK